MGNKNLMKSNGLSSMRTFKTGEDIEDISVNSKSKNNNKSRSIIKLLPWILILVLVLLSLFFWHQYNLAKTTLNTSSVQYNQQITSQLAKIIMLPTDNTPTIGTVKNANSLHNYSFYANAKNGDVVFIYPKENESILFRPSINKIINFSTSISTK